MRTRSTIRRHLGAEHGLLVDDPQHSVTWTRSMRRLYVLVRQALKNREPVLLVGETGSGKTKLCQVIAHIMKRNLYAVNAHQNMETNDLIGAQRPLRNRDMAVEQLATNLIRILKSCAAYHPDFGRDIQSLATAYDELLLIDTIQLSEKDLLEIRKLRSQVNALFEWSDGSLVTAMKTGSHFLLDEISLADDSVLERLNSVLEPCRALYLAEKGSSDAAIIAAEGFQFLATMNPGGDYGKRELSPALRNRFTEIWVPLLTDKGEAIEIVQAKMQPGKLDLARPMVDFARWFAETYESAATHSSIRDLLSWTTFINKYQNSDCNYALYHGASMVYLDRLGANPAAKTLVHGAHIPKQRMLCLEKMQDLFQKNLEFVHTEIPTFAEDERCIKLGSFHLDKKSNGHLKPQYSLLAPTTLQNAMKVARALQATKQILLEGSPGVGKTTLVAAIASSIGMSLTRIKPFRSDGSHGSLWI